MMAYMQTSCVDEWHQIIKEYVKKKQKKMLYFKSVCSMQRFAFESHVSHSVDCTDPSSHCTNPDEFPNQLFDRLGPYGWILKTCELSMAMNDKKFKNHV